MLGRIHPPTFTYRLIASLAVVSMISGCGGGGGKGDRLKTVPVSGVVTVDGQTFGPGTLEFAPAGGGDRSRLASGAVDAKGNFVMGSYEKDDGVVAGDYFVKALGDTATNPSAAMSNTAPLKVTIGAQGDKELKIDLKSQGSATADLMSPKLGGGGATPKMMRP